MKKRVLVFLLALGLLVVTGCDLTKKEDTEKKTDEKKTVEPVKEEEKVKTTKFDSTDGSFTIEAPETWEQLDKGKLNSQAVIELGGKSEVKYTMLIADKAANFTDFQAWYDIVVKKASESYGFDQTTGTDTTINGAKTKQFNFDLTSSGVKFYMRAYYIEGKTNYSQLYLWCPASDKAKMDSEFITIANSLIEK